MSVTVNIPGSNFRTFADNAGTWAVQSIVAQPTGAEVAGAAYLVAALGLGQFETKSNTIAILTANEGWYFITPTKGKLVYVAADGKTYRWDGTAWSEYSTSGTSVGTSRTISASSSSLARTITADDSNGTVIVDGADGAFPVIFDPSVLPNMKTLIKRKDSISNVNPIPVKGESLATKYIATADGDYAVLQSINGGATLELLYSGSSA